MSVWFHHLPKLKQVWLNATSLFQPLWPGRPDAEIRQRGWEAVRRAEQDPHLSDRERALVAATAAFFRDPQDDAWWPRIHRWGEALEAYETSLEIWPNRYRSLLGAARAAAATEATMAREHYGRLLEVTEGAETDRQGVREAREFLTGRR